ncbi:MAG: hypothetical protein ACRET0_15205, partial [Steroidobacteraceae bacterium]
LGLLMLGIAVPLAEHTRFIHPWFAWLSGGVILERPGGKITVGISSQSTTGEDSVMHLTGAAQ